MARASIPRETSAAASRRGWAVRKRMAALRAKIGAPAPAPEPPSFGETLARIEARLAAQREAAE